MPAALLDPASDRRSLNAFLDLPGEVYRDDPRYIAPARRDVLASLFRPDFAGAQRAWVAVADGRPAARLVARRSPALRDEAGLPLGLLGFFEAVPGPAGEEAAGRLFAASFEWLRQAGAGAVVGPMDGDTWHRYRLNVGPWEAPPFLLEPWNPPYYPALWEGQGFTILERYFSKRVDAAAVAAFLEPKRREALAAGYRLRRLEMDRFEDELRLIFRLSRAVFSRSFLYTDIPEEEFLKLYAGTRRLLDPDLVWFARAPDGQDVGFLFAFPDAARAVAAMTSRGGRRGPLGLLRFVWLRGAADAVNFKTVGVLPGHRRAGLGAALMGQGHRVAAEKGFRHANHCLFREGNPSGEMDGGTGRLLREYRLYRRERLDRR